MNNYGTNSIVATIGVIREEKIDGKLRKVVNMGFTLDERIADGIYFAKSIKLLKQILEDPELLKDSISTQINIEDKKI